MGFFNKKKNKKTSLPFELLSVLIATTTANSAEKMLPEIEAIFGKSSPIGNWVRIGIVYEFLFFYLEMMCRSAFIHLDNSASRKKTDTLRQLMVPRQLDIAYEALFQGNDEKQKQLFYEIYITAAGQYSKCTSLLVTDTLRLKESTLYLLRSRIADIVEANGEDFDYDPFGIMNTVADIVSNELIERSFQKELDMLVKDSGKEL